MLTAKTSYATHLLFSPLVLSLARLVDATKVRHYDRDWQSDDQHSAQRADTTDDLARNRLRYHVAVTVAHMNINPL